MANGQQYDPMTGKPLEEINNQSQLTGQAGAVENPATIEPQQTPQQPVQSPSSLYSEMGQLTPDRMLELKAYLNTKKSYREIKNNVGDERADELMQKVNSGEFTLSTAVDRSKIELSPLSKKIDELRYSNNLTYAKALAFRERNKNAITSTESQRLNRLLTDISSRDRQKELKKSKLDTKTQETFYKNNKNYNTANLQLQSLLARFNRFSKKDESLAGKTQVFGKDYAGGEHFKNLTDLINTELSLDENRNIDFEKFNTVPNNDMFRAMQAAINEIPDIAFKDIKGFFINDKWVPLAGEVNLAAKKLAFFRSLQNDYESAKNALNDIKNPKILNQNMRDTQTSPSGSETGSPSGSETGSETGSEQNIKGWGGK